jgi:hypothetical protein
VTSTNNRHPFARESCEPRLYRALAENTYVVRSQGRNNRRETSAGAPEPGPYNFLTMTAFVESCLETVAGSAHKAERKAKGKPRAKKLLKLLAGKKNVLITTHEHPDPDALASALGLSVLLGTVLKDTKITVSIKGQISGGVNAVFVREADLKFAPWDEAGGPEKLRRHPARRRAADVRLQPPAGGHQTDGRDRPPPR